MKKYSRYLLCLICMVMCLLFAACGQTGGGKKDETQSQGSEEKQTQAVTESDNANKDDAQKIILGVAVYNIADPEVIAFRKYFEDYISHTFNVKFEYSSGITSLDGELEFLRNMEKAGAAGIISFTSQDLGTVVEACEAAGIYYMRGSGSVLDADFDKVKNNKYFLGAVGPGESIEREAAKHMTEAFMENTKGEEMVNCLILSGGAASGNTMHAYRTEAMLSALGLDPGLAMVTETTTVDWEKGVVCIVPGLLRLEKVQDEVAEVLREGGYDVLLSSLTLYSIQGMLKMDAKDMMVGCVDCFTEENLLLFEDGVMDYVVGKYPSLIGPSFALMYNAASGYAEDFRNSDGTAVRITQGFWTADSEKRYKELYQLTAGVYENAYNFQDLTAVSKAYNPDAKLEDLVKLAESYSEEDVIARCEAR